MYENRIKHLEEMHQSLDKQIDGMEKTGRFDDATLAQLKKQRLNLKDQISDLKRKQHEHDHQHLDQDHD